MKLEDIPWISIWVPISTIYVFVVLAFAGTVRREFEGLRFEGGVAAILRRFGLRGAISWWIPRQIASIKSAPLRTARRAFKPALAASLKFAFIAAIGFLAGIFCLVPMTILLEIYDSHIRANPLSGPAFSLITIGGSTYSAVRYWSYCARPQRSTGILPAVRLPSTEVDWAQRYKVASDVYRIRQLQVAAFISAPIVQVGAIFASAGLGDADTVKLFTIVCIFGSYATVPIPLFLISKIKPRAHLIIAIEEFQAVNRRPGDSMTTLGFTDPGKAVRDDLNKVASLLDKSARRFDLRYSRGGHTHPLSTLFITVSNEVRSYTSSIYGMVGGIPLDLVVSLDRLKTLLAGPTDQAVYIRTLTYSGAFDNSGVPKVKPKVQAGRVTVAITRFASLVEASHKTITGLVAIALLVIGIAYVIIDRPELSKIPGILR